MVHVYIRITAPDPAGIAVQWVGGPEEDDPVVVELVTEIRHLPRMEGVYLHLKAFESMWGRSIWRRHHPNPERRTKPRIVPMDGVLGLGEVVHLRDGHLAVPSHIWQDGDQLQARFQMEVGSDPVELVGAQEPDGMESRRAFNLGFRWDGREIDIEDRQWGDWNITV